MSVILTQAAKYSENIPSTVLSLSQNFCHRNTNPFRMACVFYVMFIYIKWREAGREGKTQAEGARMRETDKWSRWRRKRIKIEMASLRNESFIHLNCLISTRANVKRERNINSEYASQRA